MSPADTMATLGREDVRQALRSEVSSADALNPAWRRVENMILARSVTGRNVHYEGRTLGWIAEERGSSALDTMLDIALDEELQAEFAIVGARNGDPSAAASIIQSPYALAGISDAGAHTGRLSGTYFSTYLLSHWVREEAVMTLEDAVRRLTSMPAYVYGIADRGRLASGMAGDIVIFDLESLEWLAAERWYDLPGGESRLVNGARGYEHLIVDGEVIFERGKDTGIRAGRTLRSSDYRNK